MSSEEQKRQTITLRLIAKHIRTICFAAMVIILYAAFQHNFFRVAKEGHFLWHHWGSQSFILNRIVENRHVGFSTTLIARHGMWTNDHLNAAQSVYDDYFLDRKPTGKSWYYNPSAGLQGWVYTSDRCWA